MYPRSVSVWLFACAALIVVMVVLGGLTRLTDSGLSMTQWKPVTGWLPPLSEAGWQQEFTSYQASPEFRERNPDMTVSGFKSIFWLEFIHRLVGRLAGSFFLLPLVYFFFTKKIPTLFATQLLGIFCLGGVQGLIGWTMVKSGLRDVPYVSHIWLTFHLLMAAVIFALIFGAALRTTLLPRGVATPAVRYMARALLVLVFIQIGLGGLVAGLGAGLIYNSFPDMNGQIIPDGLLFLKPWYRNMIENTTMVQFLHRLGAYSIVLMAIMLGGMVWKTRIRSRIFCRSTAAMLGIVAVQFGLGVATLLFQVPVVLASCHQLMGLILFAIMLVVNYIA